MAIKETDIQTIDNRKQVPKNLTMNILSFLVNITIGLWIVPYLVKNLGVVAYGLIPLAMFFSEYIAIIAQSLNSAINRFLLIALRQKNFLEANVIFSTSFGIMSVFAIFQIIIMFFIVENLQTFINVPEALLEDAIWLFSFTFASFSLSLIRIIYTTPIYSMNRLDYIQKVNITRSLIRVVLIVSLFYFDEPLLRYIGIANFIADLFVFVKIMSISKKLVPELKLDLSLFDKNRVKELFSMGGWVLVQQVGGLLFLKVDLYIINSYVDAYEAGRYAVIIQISNILRTMMGVFAGVVSPLVMIYYAQNEFNKLVEMVIFAIKGLGMLSAFSIGFLCATAPEILSLWLDDSFRSLELLLILSLAPLVVNLAILPLYKINTAFNKVKIPGIVTLLMGFIHIVIAIILVKYTSLGIYGVVLSGMFSHSILNILFTPLYASRILNIPKITFYKSLFSTVSVFLLVYFSTLTLLHFILTISPIGVYELIILFVLIGVISLFFIFFIVLSKKDKKLLLSIVPEKYQRKFVNLDKEDKK